MEYNPWEEWQAFAARLMPAQGFRSGLDLAGAPFAAQFADAAGRFNAAARTYLESAGTASAAATAEAGRVFSDALRDLSFGMDMPWNSGSARPEGGPRGDLSSAPTSLPNLPALGASREHQQRWQRMTQAWQRLDAAQRRLQRFWSDVLREAATAFAAKLVPPYRFEMTAPALSQFYDRWIDCAEDAYGRMAHSEPFCDALAEFVNAGSLWRQELKASVEYSAKLLDLPTRTEVNTLIQRLGAAEEELRAMRRERMQTPVARPRSARRRANKT